MGSQCLDMRILHAEWQSLMNTVSFMTGIPERHCAAKTLLLTHSTAQIDNFVVYYKSKFTIQKNYSKYCRTLLNS
jgi:hypothetical protein